MNFWLAMILEYLTGLQTFDLKFLRCWRGFICFETWYFTKQTIKWVAQHQFFSCWINLWHIKNVLDYRVLNIFEVSNSKCIMLHLRITEQKYFFSKCENFLMIYSHLLKKCLMESFIFSAMYSVFSVFLLFTFNLFSAFILYYIFNSFHANDPFLYRESLALRYSGKKGLLKIS